MNDLVGATADGCVFCGHCECGDAEDRRKSMAHEIDRLRAEIERLRGEMAETLADLEWCRVTAWSDDEGFYVKDVHAKITELARRIRAKAKGEM